MVYSKIRPRCRTRGTVCLVLLLMLFSCGVSESASASPTKFSPNAHKVALLKLLNTYPSSPHDINRIRMYPSPIDPTWVQYSVGIPVSNGSGGSMEDWAIGYAHFVRGRWVNVVGPGTGLCVDPRSVRHIPVSIRQNLRVGC